MAKKRARGGGAYGPYKERNDEREGGTMEKLDPADKATKLASARSDGFKRGGTAKRKAGGAVGGAPSAPSLAKRARGGRASSPFSMAGSMKDRDGSSTSGHEGE